MKKTSLFTRIILTAAIVWGIFSIIAPESVYAKTIRVRKNGMGDYKTIQAAVDNAVSGDTINIGPGTYVEPVTIIGKTLSLVGTNRSKCVITYPTPDYFKVPLYIQAGEVKNLTIIGHDGLAGYAIHIDNEYQYGRSITFSNCRIVSRGAQQCVGIGTYGNNSINFNNCTLESDTRIIFYHNTVRPELAGPSSINLNSCRIKGSGEACIFGINFETSDSVTVTETNCKNTFIVIPSPVTSEPAPTDPSLPAISSVAGN